MILVDPPRWPAHGTLFSHLVSDVSLSELHAAAAMVGVSPRAFDHDHYDLPERLYESALSAGAVPVVAAELVRRLVASGLRVRTPLRTPSRAAALRALPEHWARLGIGVGLYEELVARWSEPHRHYHDVRHLLATLVALDEVGETSRPVRLAAWFHDAVYDGVAGTDEERSAGLVETLLGARSRADQRGAGDGLDAVSEGAAGLEEASAGLARGLLGAPSRAGQPGAVERPGAVDRTSRLSPEGIGDGLSGGDQAGVDPGQAELGPCATLPADEVAEVARLVRLTASHDPEPGDLAGAALCDADLAVLGSVPGRYDVYVRDVRLDYARVDDDAWAVGRTAVLDQLLALDPLYRTAPGAARWSEQAASNLHRERARWAEA